MSTSGSSSGRHAPRRSSWTMGTGNQSTSTSSPPTPAAPSSKAGLSRSFVAPRKTQVTTYELSSSDHNLNSGYNSSASLPQLTSRNRVASSSLHGHSLKFKADNPDQYYSSSSGDDSRYSAMSARSVEIDVLDLRPTNSRLDQSLLSIGSELANKIYQVAGGNSSGSDSDRRSRKGTGDGIIGLPDHWGAKDSDAESSSTRQPRRFDGESEEAYRALRRLMSNKSVLGSDSETDSRQRCRSRNNSLLSTTSGTIGPDTERSDKEDLNSSYKGGVWKALGSFNLSQSLNLGNNKTLVTDEDGDSSNAPVEDPSSVTKATPTSSTNPMSRRKKYARRCGRLVIGFVALVFLLISLVFLFADEEYQAILVSALPGFLQVAIQRVEGRPGRFDHSFVEEELTPDQKISLSELDSLTAQVDELDREMEKNYGR